MNESTNSNPDTLAVSSKKEIKRSASANWQGDLKTGEGTLSTESLALTEVNYSFKNRFDEGRSGTNPEELMAAAHAGCFTMSVAAILSKQGYKATSLNTTAQVMFEELDITKVHLSITGIVANMMAADFLAVVVEATEKCMISKILNVPVTSESHFIS